MTQPQYQPAQETILYQDGTGLTITSARAIFGQKIFYLSNLTSLRVVDLPAKKVYPSILMSIGIIILFAGINQLRVNTANGLAALGIAAPLVIGSIVWFSLLKPYYVLKLSGGAGELDLVTSQDKDYLHTVATAINQAMHGKYFY